MVQIFQTTHNFWQLNSKFFMATKLLPVFIALKCKVVRDCQATICFYIKSHVKTRQNYSKIITKQTHFKFKSHKKKYKTHFKVEVSQKK